MLETANLAWAQRGIETPDVMQTLQGNLPVGLIATPRRDLRTCRRDEMLAEVLNRNHEGFDFFPVTGDDGEPSRIVGLIELVRHAVAPVPRVKVADAMIPLSEDNLIGADAGILYFVKDADRHPCRLVVSSSGITGLVSLSDLQKLPVRAALFALITYLEMVMAEAIRRDSREPEEWKKRLSPDRRSKLELAGSTARKGDNWIEDLLLTQFADKVQIIKKSGAFRGSKGAFEKSMRRIQNLRDHLAHANDYVPSRDAAKAVCETTRAVEHQISYLTQWPDTEVN